MTSSSPGRAAAARASSTGKSASGGYVHPLSGRYASGEMQHIFSQARKFTTWRRLWIALAESQRELGLDISAE
ncbi:MAG: adenylosuccinate lyase, partial [Gammaproteobacteria bacterium]|nr:adenylosuccinate lyase [Gammaproteobacteria bacterium]